VHRGNSAVPGVSALNGFSSSPSSSALHFRSPAHALNQQAKALSVAAVERLGSFNRRTLDVLAARLVAYYQLTHERLGEMAAVRGCGAELRCLFK
jgi:hypothetical protein